MGRVTRLNKPVVATLFAGAVLATTAMATPAAAAPSDQAAPQTLQAKTLKCTINGESVEYTVCEGPFTVPAGQGVYVRLDNSGGTAVDFCVEPPGGGGDFGCTGEIDPGGPPRLVWFNNTGGSRRGQLIAGRDGFGSDVLAEGLWNIRR